MIDSFLIFSQTGRVWFSYASPSAATRPDPVGAANSLISSILLESGGENSATMGEVAAEWRHSVLPGCIGGAKKIVAAAFYPSALRGRLSYVGPLLERSLRDFVRSYKAGSLGDGEKENSNFEGIFVRVLTESVAEGGRSKGGGGGGSNGTKNGAGGKTEGPVKKNTVWHDGSAKLSRSQVAALDRSRRPDGADAPPVQEVGEADDSAVREARAQFLPTDEERATWEEEKTDTSPAGAWGWAGRAASALYHRVASGPPLTDTALAEMLGALRANLEDANVASDVAGHITDGVRQNLAERGPRTVRHARALLRPALEAGVARILAPRADADVVRRALAHRGRSRRPFVVVVVGINGVGKSTSLAKIAYLLRSHKLNPLVAACDTFRSGAVEQLAVHSRCLGVPLFHRGYAKDPAGVAAAAVRHAEAEGHDVVLVDTAGRMQNNVPLMAALGKLVVAAKPDVVLFVGEALVGNDGLSQLRMFEEALVRGGHGRKIDGIVLTKWDTVSEKVGAALTMSHASGSPVVFVGTGQKYHHLRSLKVGEVMENLLDDRVS